MEPKHISKKSTARPGRVIYVPMKTRRGKTIYKEVDAASYRASADGKAKSPPKKPSMANPSHSRTAIPVSLEDTFQGEASCLDDQEPHVPRVTKVRSRLQYIIKI